MSDIYKQIENSTYAKKLKSEDKWNAFVKQSQSDFSGMSQDEIEEAFSARLAQEDKTLGYKKEFKNTSTWKSFTEEQQESVKKDFIRKSKELGFSKHEIVKKFRDILVAREAETKRFQERVIGKDKKALGIMEMKYPQYTDRITGHYIEGAVPFISVKETIRKVLGDEVAEQFAPTPLFKGEEFAQSAAHLAGFITGPAKIVPGKFWQGTIKNLASKKGFYNTLAARGIGTTRSAIHLSGAMAISSAPMEHAFVSGNFKFEDYMHGVMNSAVGGAQMGAMFHLASSVGTFGKSPAVRYGIRLLANEIAMGVSSGDVGEVLRGEFKKENITGDDVFNYLIAGWFATHGGRMPIKPPERTAIDRAVKRQKALERNLSRVTEKELKEGKVPQPTIVTNKRELRDFVKRPHEWFLVDEAGFSEPASSTASLDRVENINQFFRGEKLKDGFRILHRDFLKKETGALGQWAELFYETSVARDESIRKDEINNKIRLKQEGKDAVKVEAISFTDKGEEVATEIKPVDFTTENKVDVELPKDVIEPEKKKYESMNVNEMVEDLDSFIKGDKSSEHAKEIDNESKALVKAEEIIFTMFPKQARYRIVIEQRELGKIVDKEIIKQHGKDPFKEHFAEGFVERLDNNQVRIVISASAGELTAIHESVHVLRDWGFFTPGEITKIEKDFGPGGKHGEGNGDAWEVYPEAVKKHVEFKMKGETSPYELNAVQKVYFFLKGLKARIKGLPQEERDLFNTFYKSYQTATPLKVEPIDFGKDVQYSIRSKDDYIVDKFAQKAREISRERSKSPADIEAMFNKWFSKNGYDIDHAEKMMDRIRRKVPSLGFKTLHDMVTEFENNVADWEQIDRVAFDFVDEDANRIANYIGKKPEFVKETAKNSANFDEFYSGIGGDILTDLPPNFARRAERAYHIINNTKSFIKYEKDEFGKVTMVESQSMVTSTFLDIADSKFGEGGKGGIAFLGVDPGAKRVKIPKLTSKDPIYDSYSLLYNISDETVALIRISNDIKQAQKNNGIDGVKEIYKKEVPEAKDVSEREMIENIMRKRLLTEYFGPQVNDPSFINNLNKLMRRTKIINGKGLPLISKADEFGNKIPLNTLIIDNENSGMTYDMDIGGKTIRFSNADGAMYHLPEHASMVPGENVSVKNGKEISFYNYKPSIYYPEKTPEGQLTGRTLLGKGYMFSSASDPVMDKFMRDNSIDVVLFASSDKRISTNPNHGFKQSKATVDGEGRFTGIEDMDNMEIVQLPAESIRVQFHESPYGKQEPAITQMVDRFLSSAEAKQIYKIFDIDTKAQDYLNVIKEVGSDPNKWRDWIIKEVVNDAELGRYLFKNSNDTKEFDELDTAFISLTRNGVSPVVPETWNMAKKVVYKSLMGKIVKLRHNLGSYSQLVPDLSKNVEVGNVMLPNYFEGQFKIGESVFLTRFPNSKLENLAPLKIQGFLDKKAGNVVMTSNRDAKIKFDADYDGDALMIYKFNAENTKALSDIVNQESKKYIASTEGFETEDNKKRFFGENNDNNIYSAEAIRRQGTVLLEAKKNIGFVTGLWRLTSVLSNKDVKISVGKGVVTSGEKVQYKGGFENVGKGTILGDGKDKAMREVADRFIGEIVNENSSSATSKKEINTKKVETPKVVMLARNSEFRGQPLKEETKNKILLAYKKGAKFVVGDMPNVDSQFIDYLNSIKADYTVYHTGDKPRIGEPTTKTKDVVDYKIVSKDELMPEHERFARTQLFLTEAWKGFMPKFEYMKELANTFRDSEGNKLEAGTPEGELAIGLARMFNKSISVFGRDYTDNSNGDKMDIDGVLRRKIVRDIINSKDNGDIVKGVKKLINDNIKSMNGLVKAAENGADIEDIEFIKKRIEAMNEAVKIPNSHIKIDYNNTKALSELIVDSINDFNWNPVDPNAMYFDSGAKGRVGDKRYVDGMLTSIHKRAVESMKKDVHIPENFRRIESLRRGMQLLNREYYTFKRELENRMQYSPEKVGEFKDKALKEFNWIIEGINKLVGDVEIKGSDIIQMEGANFKEFKNSLIQKYFDMAGNVGRHFAEVELMNTEQSKHSFYSPLSGAFDFISESTKRLYGDAVQEAYSSARSEGFTYTKPSTVPVTLESMARDRAGKFDIKWSIAPVEKEFDWSRADYKLKNKRDELISEILNKRPDLEPQLEGIYQYATGKNPKWSEDRGLTNTDVRIINDKLKELKKALNNEYKLRTFLGAVASRKTLEKAAITYFESESNFMHMYKHGFSKRMEMSAQVKHIMDTFLESRSVLDKKTGRIVQYVGLREFIKRYRKSGDWSDKARQVIDFREQLEANKDFITFKDYKKEHSRKFSKLDKKKLEYELWKEYSNEVHKKALELLEQKVKSGEIDRTQLEFYKTMHYVLDVWAPEIIEEYNANVDIFNNGVGKDIGKKMKKVDYRSFYWPHMWESIRDFNAGLDEAILKQVEQYAIGRTIQLRREGKLAENEVYVPTDKEAEEIRNNFVNDDNKMPDWGTSIAQGSAILDGDVVRLSRSKFFIKRDSDIGNYSKNPLYVFQNYANSITNANYLLSQTNVGGEALIRAIRGGENPEVLKRMKTYQSDLVNIRRDIFQGISAESLVKKGADKWFKQYKELPENKDKTDEQLNNDFREELTRRTNKLYSYFKEFEWWNARYSAFQYLGLSLKHVLTNFSGLKNTYIEMGLTRMRESYIQLSRSEDVIDAANRSGIFSMQSRLEVDVSGKKIQTTYGSVFDVLKNENMTPYEKTKALADKGTSLSMIGFTYSEYLIRKMTFATKYTELMEKYRDEGVNFAADPEKDPAGYKEAQELRAEAIKDAAEFTVATQHDYTIIDKPEFATTPLGAVLYRFANYPYKQSLFNIKLWKQFAKYGIPEVADYFTGRSNQKLSDAVLNDFNKKIGRKLIWNMLMLGITSYLRSNTFERWGDEGANIVIDLVDLLSASTDKELMRAGKSMNYNLPLGLPFGQFIDLLMVMGGATSLEDYSYFTFVPAGARNVHKWIKYGNPQPMILPPPKYKKGKQK